MYKQAAYWTIWMELNLSVINAYIFLINTESFT